MQFNFPFDIKGLGIVRDGEVVLPIDGEYKRLLNLDCDGGYYRIDSDATYTAKDKIGCNKFIYEVLKKIALVIWVSDYDIDSVQQKALFDLSNNDGVIVTRVVTDVEKIKKTENIPDTEYKLLKIEFDYKYYTTNNCDVTLQCDC